MTIDNDRFEICFAVFESSRFMTTEWESLSRTAFALPYVHRRTGRYFAGGAEKFCPENNNLP